MKQLQLLLVLACTAAAVQAQNVGIGTTTPNAIPQLDVASATRGAVVASIIKMNEIRFSAINGLNQKIDAGIHFVA